MVKYFSRGDKLLKCQTSHIATTMKNASTKMYGRLANHCRQISPNRSFHRNFTIRYWAHRSQAFFIPLLAFRLPFRIGIVRHTSA